MSDSPIPADAPPPTDSLEALEAWALERGLDDRLCEPFVLLDGRQDEPGRYQPVGADRTVAQVVLGADRSTRRALVSLVADWLADTWAGVAAEDKRVAKLVGAAAPSAEPAGVTALRDALGQTYNILREARPPGGPDGAPKLEVRWDEPSLSVTVRQRVLDESRVPPWRRGDPYEREVELDLGRAARPSAGSSDDRGVPVWVSPITLVDGSRTEAPRDAAFVLAALSTVLRALLHPNGTPERFFRDGVRRALAVPPWQRALGRLERLVETAEGAAAAAEAGTGDPLGWRVQPVGDGETGQFAVEPVRCQRTKRGGFTTKRTPWAPLFQAPERVPDPRDRRILHLLGPPQRTRSKGSAKGHADPVQLYAALEAMADHPRVFLGGRGKHAPRLQVQRTAVTLDVRALADDDAEPTDATSPGLALSAAVGARALDRVEMASLVQRPRHGGRVAVLDAPEPASSDGGPAQTPTLTVVSLSDAGADLLTLLAEGDGHFPPEAGAQVLAKVPRLQRLMPVQLEDSLRGELRPASTTLRVQLELGAAGTLSGHVTVRPLPTSAAHPPGDGPVEVFGHEGERLVHAARDLGAERRALAELLVGVSPEQVAAGEGRFLIEEPEAAFELVRSLQGQPSGLVVVDWRTEPPRTRSVGMGDLRLSVRPLKEWLGVDGELGGGEGAAGIRLADALDALGRGRRWVRVSDGHWARLEDALAERLVPLAEATDPAGDDGHALSALRAQVLADLEAAGAAVDDGDGATRWRERLLRARQAPELTFDVPDGLKATLRDYQLEGFRWLARLATFSPGAVLADDMGLGKTLQALTLLLHRAALGPALVVAPTSVESIWRREANRFAPSLRVRTYRGPERERALGDLGPGDVLLTSWSLLWRDVEVLREQGVATAVFDEAHAVKNASSRTSRAAAAMQAGFRVALTGTPVENHPGELWSLFRAAVPGLFGARERFERRFGRPAAQGDAEARASLARTVRPFVLRRLKRDVAAELPERTEITLEVPLSAAERELYDRVRRAGLAMLQRAEGHAGDGAAGGGAAGDAPKVGRMQALAALTKLRQIACHPRLDDPESAVPSSKHVELMRLLRALRAEGHRALVFSQFVRHLNLVREALDAEGFRYRWLDGSTPAARREAEVAAFQAGEADVFLLSLKAGGTGLTLTAASYVIHLDPWWNPAVEDQATDRAHRIGQVDNVTVYRLVAKDTVEERVLALHADKRALVDAVLEGTGDASALKTDALLELLRDL